MEVTLYSHYMTDLDVVNMARVSFDKMSSLEPDGSLPQKDKDLIGFLARGCTKGDWEEIISEAMDHGQDGDWQKTVKILQHVKNMPTHWAPFAHPHITLKMKVPIFVARQLDKHQVGFVKSEVSRRYVSDTPEYYFPEGWRKAADNVKQGSSDELVYPQTRSHGWSTDPAKYICTEANSIYNKLLSQGVCPEQARMILPQSMYTEYFWTGSLYGWANMFIQRSDSHAQKETQEVAAMVGEIIEPLFPVSWAALTRGV